VFDVGNHATIWTCANTRMVGLMIAVMRMHTLQIFTNRLPKVDAVDEIRRESAGNRS